MKKKYLIAPIYIILISVFLQSCAYSNIQRPLDKNYENTTLGTKVGRSHITSILWLFTWGNAGTEAAAKNGNITTITHADTEYKIILFGLYTKVTTIVYGD